MYINTGGGGGSRIVYLGTGTSINVAEKLPNDYQNLTTADFIIGCTSAASKQANYTSSFSKYNTASGGFVGFTLNKSYDASTGILTISGNSYYGWTWISNSTGSPPGDRTNGGTVTPFAYAVIGEIET